MLSCKPLYSLTQTSLISLASEEIISKYIKGNFYLESEEDIV